ERQLMEQLNYNLLFRWFVGLSADDPVWDATTFTKNRDRLQRGAVFRKFMERLLDHPKVKPLLSDEHFSVDGTLIEAWASHKSFQPKDGSDDGDGSNFHGQRRKNDTHQSTSDPQAKLYRKAAGREAKLCYMGHAVMENRNGLAVDGTVTQASGTAERRASEAMLKKKAKRSGRRITVGEDKAYDTSDHIAALREMNITPHVAQNDSLTKIGKHRSSAIDRRTTRHISYRISQSCRAMSECIFGWGSCTAPCARPSTAVLPSWVPISCSISSATISDGALRSSPLEAGVRPKTPNRTKARRKVQQNNQNSFNPQCFSADC